MRDKFSAKVNNLRMIDSVQPQPGSVGRGENPT